MIENLDFSLDDLDFSSDYEVEQAESLLLPDSDILPIQELDSSIILENQEPFDVLNFDSDQLTPETIDIDDIDGVSFKASQQEINHHISHAKSEMAHAESNMRHNESIIKSKTRMGEPHSFETSQYNKAEQAYEQAKAEYNKWSHMKPDKK